MPVYRVKLKKDETQDCRLVKAANVAQARRHVAESMLEVAVADAEECVELGAAGVKLEQAAE